VGQHRQQLVRFRAGLLLAAGHKQRPGAEGDAGVEHLWLLRNSGVLQPGVSVLERSAKVAAGKPDPPADTTGAGFRKV
jgi:hypothetical protein